MIKCIRGTVRYLSSWNGKTYTSRISSFAINYQDCTMGISSFLSLFLFQTVDCINTKLTFNIELRKGCECDKQREICCYILIAKKKVAEYFSCFISLQEKEFFTWWDSI